MTTTPSAPADRVSVTCLECGERVEQLELRHFRNLDMDLVTTATASPCGHHAGVMFDFTAAPDSGRCPDCGGPLDADGYHASEWADCAIERPGHNGSPTSAGDASS